MSPLPSGAAVAALLIACAVSGAGAGSADSPAHCTNYATGAETHTECVPSVSAPPGSAIACHNYAVGSDPHAECAAGAAPRLSDSRGWKPAPALPAPALRCSTYHIGSSVYTDCR